MRAKAVVPLALAALLFASHAFAAGEEKPPSGMKKMTVTGVIKRAEIYEGKVRRVYIEDPEQGEFLVVNNLGKGKELLTHVKASVEVVGYVGKSRELEFNQRVEVLEYKILPPVEPAAMPVVGGDGT